MWKIDTKTDSLQEIETDRLDLEDRLEKWLCEDITLISSNLLIIGRQVKTDFGGVIDLLCIDDSGELVIIELKKYKTPREVTAQVLDYASWVKDLSNEEITNIANKYFTSSFLENEFEKQFSNPIPEIINEGHKMLIVGSDIDDNSERIIKYLSEYDYP